MDVNVRQPDSQTQVNTDLMREKLKFLPRWSDELEERKPTESERLRDRESESVLSSVDAARRVEERDETRLSGEIRSSSGVCVCVCVCVWTWLL